MVESQAIPCQKCPVLVSLWGRKTQKRLPDSAWGQGKDGVVREGSRRRFVSIGEFSNKQC